MKLSRFLAGFALACMAGAAWSQAYPSKPVRVVVAVPAGGSVDLAARLVSQKLTESLGQTFIVENRAGAAGRIGTEYVAKAAPDGYTLAMAPASFISSHPSTFVTLPYDPVKDFAPVIQAVVQPSVLVLPSASTHKSIPDLIGYAKANPGKLNFGSGGDGSPQHLTAVMFTSTTDTRMVHVPYKGGAPAMQDLLGGRVDLIFAPIPEALTHIRAGKLRALAVLSRTRSPVLPDVPTMPESGYPDLILDTWTGLLAPAGTPREIVNLLNAATQKALQGDLRAKLAEVGLNAAGGSPEQFGALIRSEIAMYAKLVKASGMKPME
jgi:tripartite-type tricarboxylate transporter receptor subunit TctC